MTYSIRFGPNLSPIPLTPNAELEAVLKRLFEKLGPLVREHLPAWIVLDVKYEM